MVKLSFVFLFILSFLCTFLQAQNYTLVWADSFNNGAINPNKWTFESGTGTNGWGNNELQYYTNRPENATIINNQLCIIAKKENYAGSNYTSARMISKAKQEFTYGKIEARIKLPQTQGVWPAFWMLGANIDQVNWPTCGEIDIMEHINKETLTHGTIHWNNGGHVYYGGSTTCNVSNYNVYGIEWTTDSINWYLNGTKFWTANIKNSINNTGAFHKPHFLLLNMAVGGNWPGAPNATSIFPDTMFVDYVNVFQKFPLSNANVQIQNHLSVYPNPASTELTINTSNPALAQQIIFIYNITGQPVLQQKVGINTETIKVDVSALQQGTYLLKLGNMHKHFFIQ